MINVVNPDNVQEEITLGELVPRTMKYRTEHWRLVQICCAFVDGKYELSYSFAMDYQMETLRVVIDKEEEVPSISLIYPASFLYENEMKELFGVKLKMITMDYHRSLYKIEEQAPFLEESERPYNPRQGKNTSVNIQTAEGKTEKKNRSIVPYGPQHPVLPEPIHLDLVLEDEKVVEAVPSIGYVHRGLESLVKKKDFNEMTYVVERTCGICSFMHGMGYCNSIESIMGVEVPKRADYLRTIWAEMSRIHSHLLWLGLLADAFGFESLFMQSWRMREKILDMFEYSTGGRVIFSVNKVGGVLKDMPSDMLTMFRTVLDGMEADLRKMTSVFLNDYTVGKRLKGVGYLDKKQARRLGAVGPMMRASGIDIDTRLRGYAAYGDLDFAPVTSDVGDSFARCEVRINEIFMSMDIIRQCMDKIPEGDISVPVKGMPNGEAFIRMEQPRGEAIYYSRANGTKFLDRMRMRTPTFANIPAMLEVMKGCDLADVALLVLTIDPCISCTER